MKKSVKIICVLLIIVAILGMILSCGNDSNQSSSNINNSTETLTYQTVNIKEMLDLLESNALAAEKQYQDCYVEITGEISNIDSDGDYINITLDNDDYSYLFTNIQCYITDDSQLDIVLTKTVGDKVTVKGQITNIGEVLGYSLDINEIV